MNPKEIKEIIELMKENNISEFQMERDGLKIALKRGVNGRIKEEIAEEYPQKQPVHPESIKPVSLVKEEHAPDNIVKIISPMVGTFYAAPSPDSPPYVTTGGAVKENDIVCIIEAMKVMNEIKAEVNGRIKEILVKNGEPVEFGQPLFVVER